MEAVNDGMANISLESASTATSVEDSVESLAEDLDMLNIQSPAAVRPKAPIADVVIPAYPRAQHRLREELYKVVEELPRPKSCLEWSKKEDNLLMHLVWRAGGIGSENLWSRVYDEFNPFPGGVTPRSEQALYRRLEYLLALCTDPSEVEPASCHEIEAST